MSSFRIISTLLAALTVYSALALDEDFAFDVSDDLEVEFPPDAAPKKIWGMRDLTAPVGRVFHLAIPKDSFGDAVKTYEVSAPHKKIGKYLMRGVEAKFGSKIASDTTCIIKGGARVDQRKACEHYNKQHPE